MLLAERLWPWAVTRPLGARRWWGNFGLLAIGSVLIRLIVPAAAMGAAFWAQVPRLGAAGRGARLAGGAADPAAARPADLLPAPRLPCAALAVAAAPGAPCRYRARRQLRLRFHPCRAAAVGLHQDGGGGGAGRAARGGAGVRGAAERLEHVRTRSHRHSRLARPGAAPVHRDAQPASHPPQRAARGDRQQFRLQPQSVGPGLRHLPARAPGRAEAGHRRLRRRRGISGWTGCWRSRFRDVR